MQKCVVCGQKTDGYYEDKMLLVRIYTCFDHYIDGTLAKYLSGVTIGASEIRAETADYESGNPRECVADNPFV